MKSRKRIVEAGKEPEMSSEQDFLAGVHLKIQVLEAYEREEEVIRKRNRENLLSRLKFAGLFVLQNALFGFAFSQYKSTGIIYLWATVIIVSGAMFEYFTEVRGG